MDGVYVVHDHQCELALITGLAVFSVAVTCCRKAVFAPATTPVLLKPGARVLVARGHPEHATEAVLPERALPGIY